MSRPDADRNLLFGILALQMDFLTRDQLIAGMNAWVLDKARSLGLILRDQGVLGQGVLAVMDAVIDEHIKRHGGAADQSLASLSAISTIIHDLRAIGDPDIQVSLRGVAGMGCKEETDPDRTRSVAPRTPTSTGVRYRKLRDHAMGGLGVVYVAHDAEVNREVALKEIKPGFADDPESRSRFLVEAEVTGGLEHPGIVPVYGLGKYADGRPFYAMRFIRGNSLKEAIERFHAAESVGRDPGERTLSLQKLLRRFLDVCNAIAYAHSRGILHRDLKPNNIMVGQYGETLVVDWGLAKAVGRSGGESGSAEPSLRPASASGSAETLPGSVVGTPGYMSPEQAAGRLDLLGPASDVYSLGATLYAVLTGKPPFTNKNLTTVLKQVREGEFPRPRAHSTWLDPALEAICVKAMALRAEDRYETPGGLAEDIECWMADEPVSAFREPFARRAKRWARRHRTAIAVAGTTCLVATVLLAGVAVSLRGRRLKGEAEAHEALERAIRLEAEASSSSDLAKWGQAMAEVVRAEAILASSGGDRELGLEVQRRRDALREHERDRRMVEELEEIRFSTTNIDENHSQAESTSTRYREAFRSYGIDTDALSVKEVAVRVQGSKIREHLVVAMDCWYQFSTDAASQKIGALVAASDPDPQGVALRDAFSRGDAKALGGLVRDPASRERLGPRLHLVHAYLALHDSGPNLTWLQARQRESPSDIWYNQNLAAAYLVAKPPRFEESIRFHTVSVALKPKSPGIHLNFGVALYKSGNLSGARAEFLEAIRLKPGWSVAHSNLGVVLNAEGDHEAAAEACREAIRLDPNNAMAHTNLGAALHRQGDFSAAEAAHRRATRANPRYADAYVNLAAALNSQGKSLDAITACREAIRLEPSSGDAYNNLGNALSKSGDARAAVEAHREAVRLRLDDPESLCNLASSLSEIGDFPAAAEACRQAIRLKPDLAEAYCNLGDALREQGHFAEALEAMSRGHELGIKRAIWPHPTAEWVGECRRLVEMESKIASFLSPEFRPKDSGEAIVIAGFLAKKSLHAFAVRYYTMAFKESPTLAESLNAGHRYLAACSASLAGSGRSKETPKPNDSDRSRLREEARDWLRADLTALKSLQVKDSPESPRIIAVTLCRWQANPALAGIRDADEISALPEAERSLCRALWEDIESLRKRISAKLPE